MMSFRIPVAGMVTLAIALLTLGAATLLPAAEASAATSVSGIVTENGVRAAGATVTLYRAPSGGYYQAIATTKADATGRYSFSGLSNWYWYQTGATKSYGGCQIGRFAVYVGWGAQLWATGGPRGSNINMTFSHYAYC
jgi:hypothetical protein